ncbi:AraC family transcriptional regulator [Psychromonas sp. RZ22]|uniref:GyrI-like domain-containing protein n=1 Tax=Psychromonas algarum TaxID=2555643 RepID=UPI00106788D6|nr:GyrI-like domain-containing protein [Psychromonas sp. RZ22]TEW53323.1 AraC family transcriptional regulator [Psychromonas sp. RZ22]
MQLKHSAEKVVYGVSTRTDNATEMDPEKAKIGALHQLFDSSVKVDYQNGERVYGVYFDYESDHTGRFNVLSGFDGKPLAHQTLEKVVLPDANYLVFMQQGEMPQAVINAWMEVWEFFANEQSAYQRAYTVDFEFYSGPDQVELHIAVKEP